ncbi:MAG TPA: TetR/AcrR family transcriptional regulator [Ilumatobacteraceae bacterium]|nr:TetR/AcrR family transcriptional regulator [Ilumatobacteraceae bacterium]
MGAANVAGSSASPGPKPRYSRAEIAAAAAEVPELTIAAVAKHLGTAPSSLYRYFDSREQMVVAAVDSVIGALAPPRLGRSSQPWRTMLQREVSARWTMIAAHPALIDAWWDLGWTAASSDARRSAIVARLVEAGFSAALADAVNDAVGGLIASAAETLLGGADAVEVHRARRRLDLQVALLLDGVASRLAPHS